MSSSRSAVLDGAGLRDASPLGGGSICDAYRARRDGRTVFAKTLADAPGGFFAAEKRGLAWLGEVGSPVPEVLEVTDTLIVLEWIEPGSPSRQAGEQFGRDLAELHRAEAPSFGAPWDGYIGSLSLDNATTYAEAEQWPAFYAEQRVLPFLRLAVERGAIDDAGRRAVEQLCERLPELAGPAEPPRRIHGDLWSGNVHWASDGRARLIDPAAHGGHRETDLAMLELFGLPHLDAVLAAYEESFPTADGRRERVPLHQLHPLLVHAALFGASYGSSAAAVARRALG